jgi:hypothetical protein
MITAQVNNPSDAAPMDLSSSDDFRPIRLKPRIGLGVGTFMYYGEIGSANRGYSPMHSDMAYNISVVNDLTSYLELELSGIFGNFTVSEHSLERKTNFKTEMRTLGATVRYNFGNFLNARRGIEPWISVGVASFEFLTKTDLMDANGNYYHYWSDGTIRDLPQNQENASTAILLYKDNVYETDLRDLDKDGLGKYPDRSWGIPVGAGVQWRLSERFRVRAGAEMHFTFTDNIDNLSEIGAGNRQGDTQNDRFLFTSIGINYDLNISKKFLPSNEPFEWIDENGERIMVSIDFDGDKDGVNDFEDDCLDTPEGAKVDSNGCAIDSDNDGIPDYRDDEPSSPTGMAIGNDGVAIDDVDLHQKYLMWTDSIPWETTEWAEDYAKLESDSRHWSNKYAVKVASENNGLTQAEINLLLSYKDIKSWNQGDERVYLVGSYDHLADAVKRKVQLNHEGFNGSVIKEDSGRLIEVGEKAVKMEEQLASADDLYFDPTSEEVMYRVQIGAFKHDLTRNIFNDINDLVVMGGNDGLTRYMTEGYDDQKEAAQRTTKPE